MRAVPPTTFARAGMCLPGTWSSSLLATFDDAEVESDCRTLVTVLWVIPQQSHRWSLRNPGSASTFRSSTRTPMRRLAFRNADYDQPSTCRDDLGYQSSALPRRADQAHSSRTDSPRSVSPAEPGPGKKKKGGGSVEVPATEAEVKLQHRNLRVDCRSESGRGRSELHIILEDTTSARCAAYWE